MNQKYIVAMMKQELDALVNTTDDIAKKMIINRLSGFLNDIKNHNK